MDETSPYKDPFVCPKNPGLPLYSYSEDGIGTLNPILGRGLDSEGVGLSPKQGKCIANAAQKGT